LNAEQVRILDIFLECLHTFFEQQNIIKNSTKHKICLNREKYKKDAQSMANKEQQTYQGREQVPEPTGNLNTKTEPV
jgi:hypothetical protein